MSQAGRVFGSGLTELVAESHLSSTFGMHFTLESGRDLTVPLLLSPNRVTH